MNKQTLKYKKIILNNDITKIEDFKNDSDFVKLKEYCFTVFTRPVNVLSLFIEKKIITKQDIDYFLKYKEEHNFEILSSDCLHIFLQLEKLKLLDYKMAMVLLNDCKIEVMRQLIEKSNYFKNSAKIILEAIDD